MQQSTACQCWRTTGNITSLMATCRFLYRIIQPLLFHRIDVDCSNLQRSTTLINSLEKFPELYAKIHHLTIRKYTPDPTTRSLPAFFARFHHLHSLSLIESTISTDIVWCLLQSVQLRSLELYLPRNWTNAAAKAWTAGSSPFGPPKFTSLKVTSPSYPQILPSSLDNNLEGYNSLFVPTLQKIDVVGRLWGVLPLISLNQVTILCLELRGWGSVQVFLGRCPNVEQLSVVGLEGAPPFLFSTLSRLRSVTGRLSFVASVSSGRHDIVELGVQASYLMDIFHLGLSDEQPRKLRVDAIWSTEGFQVVCGRFTQLTWLEIRGGNLNYVSVIQRHSFAPKADSSGKLDASM